MSLAQLEDILAPIVGKPRQPFSIEGVRRDWYVESDDIPPPLSARRESVLGMAVEWLRRPEARRDRAVLYLHGGGYVCGSIRSHRALTNHLATVFDGMVVSVDYRLAPEHPFPAAVDDAAAAFREIVASGCPASAIAVAGDSAGGGLAVSAALRLRDLGHAMPGALWTISPWADMTNTAASLELLAAADPIVFKESLVECARYVLAGHPPDDPLASPVLGDLTGLPPFLIQVGAREILLDDALALARAAGVAGVEATLEIWPGMVHVWHLFAPQLDEATAAIDQAARWISDRL
jgi:acetyl esterase/lipase